MIIHFIDPQNTKFCVCGLWISEVHSSSHDFTGITCKNCKRTKSFILKALYEALSAIYTDLPDYAWPSDEVRIMCCDALDNAERIVNA